jgi:secreted protein with Ig-like and vWFA domain
MNDEENGDSLEPEDTPSTGNGSSPETTSLPEADREDTNPDVPIATKTPEAVEAIEQSVDADGSPSSSVDQELRADEAASSVAVKQEMAELPKAGPEDANSSVPIAIEKPEAVEAIEQSVDADGSPSSSVNLRRKLTKWFHLL